MVKVGDTVRFLNAIGGGKVIKVDGRIATVLDDDGFETPSMVSELVVIESVNSLNFPTEKATEITPEPTPSTPDYTFNEKDETPDKEQLSIYIAFVPHNIKELQTTAYECYLVNDSNYYLEFAFFAGDEVPTLREQGEIEPQTKLFLQDVEKTELNDFHRIVFQAIAVKKRDTFDIKPAIDVRLNLNLTKFYKLHHFVTNDFFKQSAYVIALVEKDYVETDFTITSETAHKFFNSKQTSGNQPTKSKQKDKNAIVEVDLHINALLDSTAGMSNADMLNYQMQKFHETMAAHLNQKGCKIVFIHGKGEGILRKEIEKQLRAKYRSCYFQDASFREYGFGATQVTIR